MCATTALLVPRASQVCQVSKGTRVFQENQGEKGQKAKREIPDPKASLGLQE